jgi:hypothetical protein
MNLFDVVLGMLVLAGLVWSQLQSRLVFPGRQSTRHPRLVALGLFRRRLRHRDLEGFGGRDWREEGALAIQNVNVVGRSYGGGGLVAGWAANRRQP